MPKVVLAIVPARAGSKGVRGKNLRLFHGKRVVAWAVHTALKAKKVTDIVVSSDSPAILKAGKVSKKVLAYARPAALARDRTPLLDVYRHVVREFEAREGKKVDFVVGLQPTSPFRLASDIDACVEKSFKTGADVVVAVMEARENPYFIQVEPASKGSPWFRQVKRCREVRRQDVPPVFVVNGSVYVWKRETLFKNRHLYDAKRFAVHEVPRLRGVDFDAEEDFLLADFLLQRGVVRLGG